MDYFIIVIPRLYGIHTLRPVHIIGASKFYTLSTCLHCISTHTSAKTSSFCTCGKGLFCTLLSSCSSRYTHTHAARLSALCCFNPVQSNCITYATAWLLRGLHNLLLIRENIFLCVHFALTACIRRSKRERGFRRVSLTREKHIILKVTFILGITY